MTARGEQFTLRHVRITVGGATRMLIYVGPTRTNAHRLAYYPGVIPLDIATTYHLLDALDLMDAPPVAPEDLGATLVVLRVIDANARAAIYRHDGAVCGFIAKTTEDLSAGDILLLARNAFPTLAWPRLEIAALVASIDGPGPATESLKMSDNGATLTVDDVQRAKDFAKKQDAPECQPPTAAPISPEPSAADLSTMASPSTPEKKSPKSSA